MRLKKNRKKREVELGKRTYANYTLTHVCTCGANLYRDFGDSYLGYPVVGQPYAVTLCCEGTEDENGDWVDGCGACHTTSVVLDLKLTLSA
jgi:hypothetical protein